MLNAALLSAGLFGRLADEPLLPVVDGLGGPQRGGFGIAPGRGAQQPQDHMPLPVIPQIAGPQHDLEPFAQVRGGILETAGRDIQVRHQA